MKQVTCIKPMAPYHVGGERLVPDDVALRLEAEGMIAPNPPAWPPSPQPSPRPAAAPEPRRRGHSYLTKDA